MEEGEVIFTVVVEEEGCWQRQKNWKAKLAGWKKEQGRSRSRREVILERKKDIGEGPAKVAVIRKERPAM